MQRLGFADFAVDAAEVFAHDRMAVESVERRRQQAGDRTID